MLTLNKYHRIVRQMAIEGSHKWRCMIVPEVRQDGWKQLQAAKRIAIRLNIDLPISEL